jgi:hypothetical protein
MVIDAVKVVRRDSDNQPFPDAVREGVLHLVALAQRGLVQELVERVRIQRTGFMGVDALVYLLLYASMTTRGVGGMRAVWGAVSSHSAQVAGLVGRAALPSSSAMSRLLAAATIEEVYGFSRWLLVRASGVLDVMRAPVSTAVDGQGRRRRLFAFDPVRVAVRWRGCPEGEDLPPVQRRSVELVAPGHAGRKRGEAVFTIGVIEDLGSGAVLDVSIDQGNGDKRKLLCRAVDTVVDVMCWLNEPLAEALLISDGEFGGVPFLSESASKNVPFLTRCARYELLERRGIRARLEEGRWERVEDSGSGPTRWAVDIGTVQLDAGHNTVRDDGSRYDPVDVRLVASRYASAPDARGCGYQIGDNRFELFVSTGLPSSEMSAGDVVTTFYARCGQENSFLQQKLLGVHRVVSNNPAGQLFASVAAFLVWNLRLVAGIQLSPPLPEASPPVPRASRAGDAPTLPPLPEPPPVAPNVILTLAEALARVDWPRLLRARLGWSWKSDRSVLVDPQGNEFALLGVERHGNRRKLRFLDRERAAKATITVSDDVGIVIASAQRGEPPPARCAPRASEAISSPFGDDPPLAIRWPELRCAEARNVFTKAARETVVTVLLTQAPPQPTPHPLVEPNRDRRRHQRLTWSERSAFNAARGTATIQVATPDPRVARWITDLRQQNAGPRPNT